MSIVCGIDLGGTKIEGALLEVEGNNFKTIERLRLPTEKEKGYEHIVGQIKKVINQLEESTNIKITALGIGTPGTLDPSSQTMKNSNATCLNGQTLKADLKKVLGIRVEMANDANCFALAEATLGIVPEKVDNAKVVFGVIMGTGVGGGIVLQDKIWNGRQGIGGEWGHSHLDDSGGDCYCGLKGCVETIISGTGLENFYEQKSGTRKKLKDIMKLHEAGSDAIASQTVNRLLDMFAKSISSIINTLDPDAIVLGGGVGNIDLLYTAGVKKIEEYVFNNRLETPILKPKLGDSAGVFGAAMLVNN